MKAFLKQDNIILHCLRSYIHVTKASTLHIFHRGDRHVGRNSLRQTNNKQQGFTLVELVIVIVLLGIMAVGITGFITLSTQTYINVADRDELIASARFAVERLNREIRNAVPNSVRVKNQSGFNCVEFVPISASTTYIDIAVSPEPTTNTISVIPFQDIGGNNYQCVNVCDDVVIVYPIKASDVYSNHSDGTGKTFGLTSVSQTLSNEWSLVIDQTGIFDDESPTKRLYIVKSPVTYCIIANQMFRFDNYSLNSANYVAPFVFPALMADNLANEDIANYPFTVSPASLQRNAQVLINLHFQINGENIVFENDITLKNVP